MFNYLESWLVNKTNGHVNKKNVAKLVSGFLLAVLSVITFIRYELIKNAGEKAELQNVLSKDTAADATTAAKIDVINTKVEEHLDAAKTAEKAANHAITQAVKIDAVKHTDEAVINSINSWSEADTKVK